MVHGDDAADQIRTLFRYERRVNVLFFGQKYLWGVVVGHRTGESRDRGRLGVGKRGVRVEAEVSDRVDLEDRISGTIPGNRGFRCGVTERRGGFPEKNFSGVLLGPTR